MTTSATALAAKRCGRDFVGFELNPDYCAIIEQRLAALAQELAAPAAPAPKAAKAAVKKPAAAKKPAALKKPPAVKKTPARKARSAGVPEDVVI